MKKTKQVEVTVCDLLLSNTRDLNICKSCDFEEECRTQQPVTPLSAVEILRKLES